ncbi:dihydrofolate reductase family protein [Antarcticirhabdus aurantiaca]|uniref:RibD family protein n=1 Tax=Antarcticirhabdus aurantiaca TaxID=2606717 RepID=A0ACD4NHE8_9HYPH|nr:RibD family protein [Antarcticirhabdus aurantiaca]WAJ26227.1 RibD family protein [Jeongeuplla avenae]
MKPHVLCHMMISIDGRVRTEGWAIDDPSSIFETIHDEIAGDAWLVGRVTIERDFDGEGEWEKGLATGPVERTDWFEGKGAKSYAVAVDRSGRIAWKSGAIDGEPVIAILSRQVSDDYLAFLQKTGVSYVFGGDDEIDFAAVLETLNRELGIERLLVEGGGGVNGSLMNAGLVDELSVAVVPVTDGRAKAPSLFDVSGAWAGSRPLELQSVTQRDKGVVWLRYKVLNDRLKAPGPDTPLE